MTRRGLRLLTLPRAIFGRGPRQPLNWTCPDCGAPCTCTPDVHRGAIRVWHEPCGRVLVVVK